MTGSQATLPSFTGKPSGENATEVSSATDGPYLIQAASTRHEHQRCALLSRILMQTGKGVLGAESSISNNNPPKQVNYDEDHRTAQRPPSRRCRGDGLADAERDCHTLCKFQFAGR